MSDYKEHFENYCGNCAICELDDCRDDDHCYHENFYRVGFADGFKQGKKGERTKAIDKFLFEIDQCNEIGISDEEFEIIKQIAEQLKEQTNE